MFKKLAGFFAQPKEIEVNKTQEEIEADKDMKYMYYLDQKI